MFSLKLISSLDKVFATGESPVCEVNSLTLPKNGRISFQALVEFDSKDIKREEVTLDIEGWEGEAEVFLVKSVPSRKPVIPGQKDVLRSDAGFFPDALIPLEEKKASLVPNNKSTFWITLSGAKSLGEQWVTIRAKKGEEEASDKLIICALNYRLKDQEIYATQWLHNDCIAHYHGVGMHSPRYWELLRAYLETASGYGLNTIITPIFTPPLDTEVGTYRMSCQLTEVFLNKGEYTFGFEKLDKWIDLCRDCGFNHFELSHLFTQWGAKAAPQINATVDGEYKRIFGWDTPSESPEYLDFLKVFLSALRDYLDKKGVLKDCFIHISDEPKKETMSQYSKCAAIIREFIPEIKIMDAIEDYEVYRESGIDVPVVSLDKIDKYIEEKVNPLWGYYCWVQVHGESNRFFSMPSSVTRIFGIQAYVYNLQGFLHWGYNFYNSFLSLGEEDPYTETEGGTAYPGGDAFSVYPAKDGCNPSIRLSVFYDGLTDLRALRTLEDKIGRDEVLKFIESEFGKVTFTEYSRDPGDFISFRNKLDFRIENEQ